MLIWLAESLVAWAIIARGKVVIGCKCWGLCGETKKVYFFVYGPMMIDPVPRSVIESGMGELIILNI